MDHPVLPPPRRSELNTPFNVLLLLLAAVLVGSLLGQACAQALVGVVAKSDLPTFLDPDKALWTPTERQLLRLVNIFIHLGTFSLSAIAATWFFHAGAWPRTLRLHLAPRLAAVWWAVWLLLASFPVAQWLYWFNQQLPLPAWMQQSEDAQNGLIAILLQMDSPLEFAVTFATAAIVPAVGEELLFRGVLQQQLQRWWRSGHLAVWVGAAVFSAIHLQFAGFLPRLLLGALLGYLLWWRGNLWLPIAGHLAFNGLQVLAKYTLGDEVGSLDPAQATPPPWYLAVLSLVVMGYAGWRLWRPGQQPDDEGGGSPMPPLG